uniref:Uncharacterized protein n=1 Tax=Macaca mulatta TaxID=9544 RepID=A0A5F7ZPJ7_MACMU
MVIAHCSLELPGSSSPLTLAFRVAGTTGEHHHARLTFLVFFVEIESHHVAQGVLELASNDPVTSASRSAEITGMSHCTSLNFILGFLFVFL